MGRGEDKKPRKATKRIPDEHLIEAIKQARGMTSYAAKIAKCSRRTIQKRIKENPEIAQAHEDARDLQLDRAELELFKAIDAGRAWAICFYLKCIGKDRGYVEKQELQHSGKVEIEGWDIVGKVTPDPKPAPDAS